MTLDRNENIRRAGDTDDLGDTDVAVEERHVHVEAAESSDENAEVAELRADIEETRLEMGGTLNELGDRLEPGHLMDQAKENVRDATIGRVEESVKGMSDMVVETIKQNPIPAALAGAGLALLWMNRSSGDGQNGHQRSSAYDSYRYDPNTGQRLSTSGGGGKDIGQRVSEGASSVGESVGHARENVGEVVGQAGETVGQTVGQAGQQLDRFMQASPLAMGAIALGAGAVIGAVVPETQIEREKLGEASRQIGETVREGVDQAADQAEQAMDEAERSVSSSRSSTPR